MASAHIVRNGGTRAGEPLNIFGDCVTIKVSGADTGGVYSVIHGATPPLGGPPLHKHLEDSETFHVLKGRFAFMLDGERLELEEGDTVFIPAGVVHQYQNIGSEVGEVLLFVEPAGLDEFFYELDALLKASTPPDMGAIAELHARYKMELLGPPMAAL